jgi:hypothetical protein
MRFLIALSWGSFIPSDSERSSTSLNQFLFSLLSFSCFENIADKGLYLWNRISGTGS